MDLLNSDPRTRQAFDSAFTVFSNTAVRPSGEPLFEEGMDHKEFMELLGPEQLQRFKFLMRTLRE